MKKHSKLFGVFAGALAAAMLAMPATAFATTTITSSDFVDGVYEITSTDDYELSGGVVSGKITADCDFTLDLKANTLANSDSDSPAILVSGKAVATISNGTIRSNGVCVKAQDSASVTVSSLDAVAYGDAALEAADKAELMVSGDEIKNSGSSYAVAASGDSHVYLNGGTFTPSGSSASVNLDNNAAAVIRDGVFKAGVNMIGSSTSLSISGGSFSDLSNLSSAADGIYAFKEKDSDYYVYTDDLDACNDKATKRVDLKSGQTAFFEDEDQAYAYYYTVAGAASLNDVRVTVTFDAFFGKFADGGDTLNKVVLYGNSVTDVEIPTRAGYVFKYWTDNWYNPVDPATTKYTSDVTVYAEWEEAVASVGDEYYTSLQGAVDAAQDGDTVTLLKNTQENVKVAAGKTLTIDLNEKELSCLDEDSNTLLINGNGGNVTVKNGSIVSSRQACVRSNVTNGTVLLSGLTLTGGYGIVSQDGVTTIDDCECVGTYNALIVQGAADPDSSVTVKSGSFKSNRGGNSAYVSGGGDLSVENGTFDTHIDNNGGTVSISGGTFGNAINAGDVAEGYAMYKPSDEVLDGAYVVLEADKARQEADWGVTTFGGVTVYFDTKDDAQAYADDNKDDDDESPVVYKLHMTVTFMRTSEEVYATTHVEYGDDIELPETDPTFPGYDFLGWYYELDNGSFVPYEETDEIYDDVTLHALWLEQDSGDEGDDKTPTDDPEEKSGDSDKKDDASKLPQTGDVSGIASAVAATGAALAGFGALRRRK
jgi:uncharacterized repeat protein (TIGR02543 family)/LPXTG-motif cell wall-anchored protein